MLYSQQIQGLINFMVLKIQNLIKFSCFIEVKDRFTAKSKGTEAALGEDSHHHEHSEEEDGLHTIIGLSLVLGFVFMLLIDQIGASRANRGNIQLKLFPK